MKRNLLITLTVIFVAVACGKTGNAGKNITDHEALNKQAHWGYNWAWMYVNRGDDDVGWNEKLSMIEESRIDGILLLLRNHEWEEFVRISKKGKALGLEMHAWLPLLN